MKRVSKSIRIPLASMNLALGILAMMVWLHPLPAAAQLLPLPGPSPTPTPAPSPTPTPASSPTPGPAPSPTPTPSPGTVTCDFTTGGGFVLTDQGNHANFGLVGGCKNGGFFGHVNFVDHDTSGTFAGLHVSSTEITGYVDPCINGCGNPPQYRDICGTADTNLFGSVNFRVRTLDAGEPGSGPNGPDRFGLKIEQDGAFEFVVVSTRFLAGGNIQLHKPNPSTTGPNPAPDESTACHVDDSGLGP